MSERICDVCGKKKNIEGGKTCENGHFICKSDLYSGIIFVSGKKHCPIDKSPLR